MSVYNLLVYYGFVLYQRRIVGLHQDTSIGSNDIIDNWEPLEEGLNPYVTVDHSLALKSGG